MAVELQAVSTGMDGPRRSRWYEILLATMHGMPAREPTFSISGYEEMLVRIITRREGDEEQCTHDVARILNVICRCRCVATDVASTVLDATVQQGKERDFDELASGHSDRTSILGGHAELRRIEHANVLEERAFARDRLALSTSVCPAETVTFVSCIHEIGTRCSTHASTFMRSLGIVSYESLPSKRN